MLEEANVHYWVTPDLTKNAIDKMVASDLEKGRSVMIHLHRSSEKCIPKDQVGACTRLTLAKAP
jgi:hypothetical protein